MTTSAYKTLAPTAARKRPWQKARAYAWRYALLVGALVFFSFPAFWIATIAFKSSSEYFRNPPVWIPASPNIAQNLDKVVRTGGLTSIGNSLIVTTSATLIALIVATGIALLLPADGGTKFLVLGRRAGDGTGA